MGVRLKNMMKSLFRKIVFHYKKHPILLCLVLSFAVFTVPAVLVFISEILNHGVDKDDLYMYFIIFILIWIFIAVPLVLTIINMAALFFKNPSSELSRGSRRIEALTIFLGIVYSVIYAGSGFSNITFNDWWIELWNLEKHSPILAEALPTILAIIGLSMLGYIIVRYGRLEKLPPLVLTFCIAGMYLGAAQCVLWIVQIWEMEYDSIFFSLLPFNFILIVFKTIKELIFRWQELQAADASQIKESFSFIQSWLMNSSKWPVIGLILILPLLGIVIVILMLFGQAPDSFIKAWTETADWSLSKRIAPQNVMYDEHYLCTVAAGGHKRVVKPLRLGVRHGHEVIVNRQLCVANAFEQILEERTPRLHAVIRDAYDKYGYPIAKNIKSPFMADFIYYVMKPAEWFFLMVIYLCDSKPENRIALQYIPKPHMRFEEIN